MSGVRFASQVQGQALPPGSVETQEQWRCASRTQGMEVTRELPEGPPLFPELWAKWS